MWESQKKWHLCSFLLLLLTCVCDRYYKHSLWGTGIFTSHVLILSDFPSLPLPPIFTRAQITLLMRRSFLLFERSAFLGTGHIP